VGKKQAAGTFKNWWKARKLQLQLQSDPIGADAAALAVAKFASPRRLTVQTNLTNSAATSKSSRASSVRGLLSNSIVLGNKNNRDDWAKQLQILSKNSGPKLSDSLRPQYGADAIVGPFDGSLRPQDVPTPTELSPSRFSLDMSKGSFDDSDSFSDTQSLHEDVSDDDDDISQEQSIDATPKPISSNSGTPQRTDTRNDNDDKSGFDLQPDSDDVPSDALASSLGSSPRGDGGNGSSGTNMQPKWGNSPHSMVDDSLFVANGADNDGGKRSVDNFEYSGSDDDNYVDEKDRFDDNAQFTRSSPTRPNQNVHQEQSNGEVVLEQGHGNAEAAFQEENSESPASAQMHDRERESDHDSYGEAAGDDIDYANGNNEAEEDDEYDDEEALYSMQPVFSNTRVSSRKSSIQLSASSRSNATAKQEPDSSLTSSSGGGRDLHSQRIARSPTESVKDSYDDADRHRRHDASSHSWSPNASPKRTGTVQQSVPPPSSNRSSPRGSPWARSRSSSRGRADSHEDNDINAWGSEEDDDHGPVHSDGHASWHADQKGSTTPAQEQRFVALGETDALLAGLFPAGTNVLVHENAVIGSPTDAADDEYDDDPNAQSVAGIILHVYEQARDALYDIEVVEDVTLGDGSKLQCGLVLKQIGNRYVRPDFDKGPTFDDSFDSNGDEGDIDGPASHESDEENKWNYSRSSHRQESSAHADSGHHSIFSSPRSEPGWQNESTVQQSPRIKLDLFPSQTLSGSQTSGGNGTSDAGANNEIYSLADTTESHRTQDDDYLVEFSDPKSQTQSHVDGNTTFSSSRRSDIGSDHGYDAPNWSHHRSSERAPAHDVSASNRGASNHTAFQADPRSHSSTVSPRKGKIGNLAPTTTQHDASDFDTLIDTMLEQGQLTFKKIQQAQAHIESGKHTKEHYVKKWKKKLAKLKTKASAKVALVAERSAHRAQTPRARKLNDLNLTNQSQRSYATEIGLDLDPSPQSHPEDIGPVKSPSQNRAPPDTAMEAVPQQYGCDFNCGFQGVYDVVAEHEKTCPLAPKPVDTVTDSSTSPKARKKKKKKKDKKDKKANRKKKTESPRKSGLPAMGGHTTQQAYKHDDVHRKAAEKDTNRVPALAPRSNFFKAPSIAGHGANRERRFSSDQRIPSLHQNSMPAVSNTQPANRSHRKHNASGSMPTLSGSQRASSERRTSPQRQSSQLPQSPMPRMSSHKQSNSSKLRSTSSSSMPTLHKGHKGGAGGGGTPSLSHTPALPNTRGNSGKDKPKKKKKSKKSKKSKKRDKGGRHSIPAL